MIEFATGREAGTTFEKIFERQCQLYGLWAEANLIKARRGWKGKLQELKSNLDYQVISRAGKIAFIDCKTFDGSFFTFSDLAEHQVEMSYRYESHGIRSGFAVWFRTPDQVVFFTGRQIKLCGPRTRFCFTDGWRLGTWSLFDPTLIFDVPSGSPSCSLDI